jgi:type II restriction enzyme
MTDTARWRFEPQFPLKQMDGSSIILSPRIQNELQIAVIEEFGPRFAPGASVLHVRDAAQKQAVFNARQLSKLNVPATEHDKLADIILFWSERNWLFLIEAITSHGPVSTRRYGEIAETLKSCPAHRIYVTTFLTRKAYQEHADNIAWETEVWIAENADHMIHYDGSKLLGPYVRK